MEGFFLLDLKFCNTKSFSFNNSSTQAANGSNSNSSVIQTPSSLNNAILCWPAWAPARYICRTSLSLKEKFIAQPSVTIKKRFENVFYVLTNHVLGPCGYFTNYMPSLLVGIKILGSVSKIYQLSLSLLLFSPFYFSRETCSESQTGQSKQM